MYYFIAVCVAHTDDEEENQALQPDKNELQNTLRTLGAKLEDLNTCNDLITKHGAALQKALGELETLEPSQDVAGKIKSVNERATLFRITSNAMINVSGVRVCEHGIRVPVILGEFIMEKLYKFFRNVVDNFADCIG